MGRICLFVVSFLAITLISSPSRAQHHAVTLDFETSCAAETHGEFGRAVTLLHHMMYVEAEEGFRRVAETDPGCAMAYWGLAMTQLHPLWAPPTPGEIEKGAEAVRKAQQLGAPTDRGRGYIDAIGAFFLTEGDFSTRLGAWTAGQQKLHEVAQDDVDAAAFYALAQLATAPRNDPSFSQQEQAGRSLEQLLAGSPQHPGLFHYTIHAYDNPRFADRAVDVARGYDRLAPEVPHALHMPSHIFVRQGLWEDVAAWNRRSADAALKHVVNGKATLHFPHAMDYLVYARLQQGRDADAVSALEELKRMSDFNPELGVAYGLAAPPARVALERRAWADAAALPIQPENFPWDRFPAAESITWFARGVGAARSGDPDAAERAIEQLNFLHQKLVDANESYWAILTDAQRIAVGAWLQYEEGNKEDALETMKRAADLEDSVDKHPVTPSAVLPARELYGEMLLLEGRTDEALEAFEASLMVSRNRLNSLTGAARAAELAGDAAKAGQYYAQVLEITGGRVDVDRPRFEYVRAYSEKQ